MPFDLMAIKAEIENMFDAEFTVQDLEYMDGKELVLEKDKKQIDIHISNYTYEARLGEEYIAIGFWNKADQSGFGYPCDSIEELVNGIDKTGLPRRTVPRQRMEQMSLW